MASGVCCHAVIAHAPLTEACLLLQDLHLPSVFENMECNKEELGIAEYSLTQTTLENVFVALAQPGG